MKAMFGGRGKTVRKDERVRRRNLFAGAILVLFLLFIYAATNNLTMKLKTGPQHTISSKGVSICISASVVLGVAYLGVRRGLLESGILPHDCSAAARPRAHKTLCALKHAITFSCAHQRIGWLSLGCSMLSLALGFGDAADDARPQRNRRRQQAAAAWGGWLLGVAGLVLYGTDPAAVGALVSLLVLTSQ